jgi:AcrR family transcriptional regulator
MAAASEIVSTEGLDGLTMQAVADRVECAVGTIYTYFDSKSSLLTALQIAAIETLGTSFRRSRSVWDEDLAESDLDDATVALVRLVAFGHLFTSAPSLHPREFELLQVLLSTRRRETSDDDARKVLPYALGLINEFRLLIEAAVEVGALRGEEQGGTFDDHSLGRTIAWAGALNGALLVSNVAAVPADGEDAAPTASMGDVFDGRMLALRVGRDLLAGWGAPLEQLLQAEEFVHQLRERDRIAVSGAPQADADGTVDLTATTAAAAAES